MSSFFRNRFRVQFQQKAIFVLYWNPIFIMAMIPTPIPITAKNGIITSLGGKRYKCEKCDFVTKKKFLLVGHKKGSDCDGSKKTKEGPEIRDELITNRSYRKTESQ